MISDALAGELEHELISTVKCLARLPLDKGDWKPHEKSMTLKQLAQHIAEIPGYVATVMDTDQFDIGGERKPPAPINSAEEFVTLLTQNVEAAIGRLRNTTQETMQACWALRNDGQEIFNMPRYAVIRGMVIKHLVHHRGQLSVYLRMLDVSVPSIYGPSADEAF